MCLIQRKPYPVLPNDLREKTLTWFLVRAVLDFDGLYDGGDDIGLHAGEVLAYGSGL